MHIVKLIEHFDKTNAKQNIEGKRIRETVLVPALKDHEEVVLDLGGYNRWTRSLLNELIANLIREDGYTRERLKAQLKVIPPKYTQSIGSLVDNLINIAEMQRIVKPQS